LFQAGAGVKEDQVGTMSAAVGRGRTGVGALIGGALILGGCYRGTQGDPGGASAGATEGDGSGGADDDAASGGSDAGDGEPFGSDCDALPRVAERLSARHYGNAVRDLLKLAEAPRFTSGGEQLEAFIPQGSSSINTLMAVELQQLAEAAASEATEDLAGLVGCDPSLDPGVDEDACASAFLETLASRAFRRPLEPTELDGLLGVYLTGKEQDDTFRGGIELAIQAVLQSPSFLYHVERGQMQPNGLFVLDEHELAAALGFFLLDSVPDDELWAAAERGDLADADGVRAQVERLLQDPRVQANVATMFTRWFGTPHIVDVERDDPAFTDTLRASMRAETERFVHDVLWARDASMHELFTSRETFVDAELAALYGVPHPGGDEMVPVTLPEDQRAGLLTHASVLASRAHADESSIVHRGLLVARDLLCIKYGVPPEGATDPSASMGDTEREKATYRMSTAPCSACHSTFEPFGVLLENYDAIGRFRTETPTAPVESSWDIEAPESLAGSYARFLDLAETFAASEELYECTAARVTGYAVGRALEGDERCHEDLMSEAFLEAEGDLVELVRIIATSESFRYRRGEGP
jgi:hypothetical protein